MGGWGLGGEEGPVGTTTLARPCLTRSFCLRHPTRPDPPPPLPPIPQSPQMVEQHPLEQQRRRLSAELAAVRRRVDQCPGRRVPPDLAALLLDLPGPTGEEEGGGGGIPPGDEEELQAWGGGCWAGGGGSGQIRNWVRDQVR